jgi:hypothetical protein
MIIDKTNVIVSNWPENSGTVDVWDAVGVGLGEVYDVGEPKA